MRAASAAITLSSIVQYSSGSSTVVTDLSHSVMIQTLVPPSKGTIVSGPVFWANVSPIPSLVAMEPWKWQVEHSQLLS